ncbi:FemAB family XrtA/PEP-CTERM system-associated protein [Azospirillum canadense]|uniref:FemAB family XrtA/PEP-CTERM system-associated protein n=1 Tax=Azospirillum canadense TaxID=403962 RepID=UPI002226ADB8|nr:FemAB family XrtA/PEP-CTERM system-associated protein [Azospirillum canadense]MCW2240894.1 FemAB-related protein (PEP-CTERM system-associated) [Azospirillum canadense]
MSGVINIRLLDESGEGAWDAFVDRSPEATFFHRASWRRVIHAAYGHRPHYLMAWRGGEVVGVLPLVHVRSPLFGNGLISTAFFAYGGIAADDTEVAWELAERAKRLGAELGVGHVELRHRTPRDNLGWTAKTDLYATFRRPITADEASNLKAIPRKKRADVRKSLGNGLTVDTAADVATFHRIYAHSVHTLGTPVFPRHFFARLQREFGPAVEISAVHGPTGPVAALVSFFFRGEVLPYYGGALPAARGLHAYDHMYWTLMCRAAERGCTVFDFGRSKRGTGAFDYKTYWGFEPEALHYQYHLVRRRDLPNVNPLNPKYRLMVEAWKRLPLSFATALGPHIARQLG